MGALNALVYVTGIYFFTLLVTLFVVVVIVGIRWATADRIKLSTTSSNPVEKKERAKV